MPPLNDTLRKDSPEGFAPASTRLALPVPALPGQADSFRANPIIRCPLPPINAGPDTLRQFNDGNTDIPRRRVLPLPVTNSMGGTIVNNTTVINSAGSSSGSVATSLSAKTIIYTAPVLSAGSSSYAA
jgi:hypothetical protein